MIKVIIKIKYMCKNIAMIGIASTPNGCYNSDTDCTDC